ncbi:hypothetical protein BDM02DRAFT_3109429 [Thelephora ganbajun]|uniref:Uncharacterized protein n=1 Tax=Thelephora ganbajun TaxID=370292 RepID=A0ACB6ZS88_THEGA|nr:hypothetical protein BDM02DRAFT_3109429 [Thelephora ganbajun]
MAWNTTWFLLSAMMVMLSSEFICVLTQPLECVVTPIEALFQVKEIIRKHKSGTLL